jgi:hypothetical protein
MGPTAKQIEAARPGADPEGMSDRNGLYLRVYKSGRKAVQVPLGKDGKTVNREKNCPRIGVGYSVSKTGPL